jgi:hypothetical protein
MATPPHTKNDANSKKNNQVSIMTSESEHVSLCTRCSRSLVSSGNPINCDTAFLMLLFKALLKSSITFQTLRRSSMVWGFQKTKTDMGRKWSVTVIVMCVGRAITFPWTEI